MSDPELEIIGDGFHFDRSILMPEDHAVDLGDFFFAEGYNDRAHQAQRDEERRRQRRQDREQRRRAAPHHRRPHHSPYAAAMDLPVIDLTNEPDSPVRDDPAAGGPSLALPNPQEQPPPQRRNHGFLDRAEDRHRHHPHYHHHHGHHRSHRSSSRQSSPSAQGPWRHPRRQMPGLARTPSLARGDASINGRGGNAAEQVVIDLTDLDDLQPEAAAAAPRQPAPAVPAGPLPMPARRTSPSFVALPRILGLTPPPAPPPRGDRNFAPFFNQIMDTPTGRLLRAIRDASDDPSSDLAANFGIDRRRDRDTIDRIMYPIGMAAGINLDLNYAAGGVGFIGFGGGGGAAPRPEPPKPPYNAPPAAPDGFSNDTGEDVVAVCPGCEEELVYDPDSEFVQPPTPSGKKSRSKKDRMEHHFMAVKACGHVFCRNCYENRKALSKSSQSAFRPGQRSTSVMCAVKDCPSDVAAKTAWLGVFT